MGKIVRALPALFLGLGPLCSFLYLGALAPRGFGPYAVGVSVGVALTTLLSPVLFKFTAWREKPGWEGVATIIFLSYLYSGVAYGLLAVLAKVCVSVGGLLLFPLQVLHCPC